MTDLSQSSWCRYELLCGFSLSSLSVSAHAHDNSQITLPTKRTGLAQPIFGAQVMVLASAQLVTWLPLGQVPSPGQQTSTGHEGHVTPSVDI